MTILSILVELQCQTCHLEIDMIKMAPTNLNGVLFHLAKVSFIQTLMLDLTFFPLQQNSTSKFRVKTRILSHFQAQKHDNVFKFSNFTSSKVAHSSSSQTDIKICICIHLFLTQMMKIKFKVFLNEETVFLSV